jgi:hypothetical protein
MFKGVALSIAASGEDNNIRRVSVKIRFDSTKGLNQILLKTM